MDVSINYLAVLVAGIANMVIGFIWYGPLFGKPWMSMMGINPADTAKMAEMKKSMGKTYTIAFIGALLMAYVMSHILTFAMAYMKTEGWAAGISTGFWNWLGFVAPVTIGIVLWDRKPMKLWVINAGYFLVVMMVMGVILASWR